ncbi:MAG: sensor histidine kinase KdpD [Verrucomicrobiales bacterium]|nr:sensor histidine kinase KdpD [Verrucomicrobiales bacterium]
MNDDNRPDPDDLLVELQRDEVKSKQGRLFIFLGMCPGVGKTYAMLQAARQRVAEGVDVLAGVIETHGRAETAALLEGMRVLPRRQLEHRGFTLDEFDIDAVLVKKPRLVLVDELAHTNAPGSRHSKRYQDVLELIESGIDVYTTLNVQHIESQVDIVRQISGVAVTETVPDSILDLAHEIQLIDLSVEKLLERMADGKVYLGERAELAISNFFKEGNLTALRELALRFTAEQVDRDLEDIRRLKRVSSPWKTNARLMVGVGPSPYAESLIRWTRRAAARLNCPWLVVWVESSRVLTATEQERLTRSLGLARKLGGEVVSVTGENVSIALLQVARERNVTQIVVGKPDKQPFWRKSLADQLILGSGDIDVCVVRPLAAPGKDTVSSLREPVSASTIAEFSWVLVSVFTIASLCWSLVGYTGYMFVALVFLLAVVLAALRLSRGPVLAMATLSAVCWNFFFIPPIFTFHIGKPEDWIMFGMFFIVALSMGSLTHRLRLREMAERRRARLTDALLRMTQSAALSAEREKGLETALRVIDETLHARTALVVRRADRSLDTQAHPASSFDPPAKEWGVVAWTHNHKQTAGRDTDTLPDSFATWFPLQTATSMMGVLGVRLEEETRLDFTTRETIAAFALQLALVLEKEHFIQAIHQAEILTKSENLRRALLDNVSHELKTPLAVIQAALDGTGREGPFLGEMATAAGRLQRVVDGLLEMNRLESGALHPSLDWCDLHEIIATARDAVGTALQTHPVSIHLPDDLPLVRLDPVLFAQCLANLLHNGAAHTPPGTPIKISAGLDGSNLHLAVRDHGPGLPPGAEIRVFEKFFRAENTPTGGTGLGLAIVRGLVRAMDGEVVARNAPGGGAEFAISLPGVETFHEPAVTP